MTDYEKKLIELKNTNAEIDTYMGVDDSLVIQYFINDYVFTEFVYTENGDFVEEYTINCYPKS